MILDGKNWLVQYETGDVSICVFAGVVNSTLPHDDHHECYHLVDGSWTDEAGEALSSEDSDALNALVENVHEAHLPDKPVVIPDHVEEPTAQEIAAAVGAPFVQS